jgi:hypothetical protein
MCTQPPARMVPGSKPPETSWKSKNVHVKTFIFLLTVDKRSAYASTLLSSYNDSMTQKSKRCVPMCKGNHREIAVDQGLRSNEGPLPHPFARGVMHCRCFFEQLLGVVCAEFFCDEYVYEHAMEGAGN